MPDAPRPHKLVIIGSGPAGWTAAIYAARAALDPVIYIGTPRQDPGPVLPGGQLMLTTEVENYPGFPHGVQGPEMMDLFRKQAERFNVKIIDDDMKRCEFAGVVAKSGGVGERVSEQGGNVASAAKALPKQEQQADAKPWASERPATAANTPAAYHTLYPDSGPPVRAAAVIIATGAQANWLGLENEMRLALSGGGVSACAVCDGALPLFRGQELAVVGGGDTAMEEATYLTKFASTVHMIHRRDAFRASKVMQARLLSRPNVKVHWNKAVADVLGGEKIEGVALVDTVTGEKSTLTCKGLFIAIGHTPATKFLQGSGLEFNAKGYIDLKTRHSMTNVPGVFAAGDVADAEYRQAITAAGMGCQAALDAERWLAARGVD